MAGETVRPTTEAGRRRGILLVRDILEIEAAARAEAGHRTPEPHDCFLMNCADLGDEVRALAARLAATEAGT